MSASDSATESESSSTTSGTMANQRTADDTADSRLRELACQLFVYARDLKTTVQEAERRAEELAVANERLQRLDQLKMDFLSLISHELRTPLTSMAMVTLLETGGMEETPRSIVNLVKGGYERLASFVSQGIEYLQVLSDDDQFGDEESDLTSLIQQSLARHPRLLAQWDAGERPCPVRGDARALGRAIEILVHNAVKHAEGPPQLTIRIERGPERVRLMLCDRGKGFDPGMAAEIMRPFTPADVDHHSTGAVVSLALAVQLVERCGGTLAADSEGRGKGATFTLELKPGVAVPAQATR